MIQVKKDTIYLYDELNNNRYILYRNHITSILIEERYMLGNTDLDAYEITINCDDHMRFFITINEDTIIRDLFNLPFSAINNDEKYSKYRDKLDDYIKENGIDRIEKIIFKTSEDISELFEKIANGDEDFEHENIRFRIDARYIK